MSGVEGGSIRTPVSSSLPYARAECSPFRTVVLQSLPPGGPAGDGPLGGSNIPAFRYARAAEMAGRAGRDRAGEVFVLAPQGNRPDPPRPGA